ncbi:lipopolysaccharide biosynthesis (plasmid) [Aliiroseovarius sp. M344]|uniref:lipopolysaccharide biosynthesis n=1 Tax=Aliiroseovarius sp. M344 TaxID=2867010 RepID=UPI0021AD930C|nr:lipopolysaccharide biosynthesis [Aliiroseovarius sp. M344]UWQ16068.1 lipopolysaccharide biosynthesis [Aliiroseovarius sp. M344]
MVVATVIGAASVIMAMSLPPAFVSRMILIVESPQIPNDLAASTASTPAPEQLQIVEQRLMTRANLLDIANKTQVFENINAMTPDRIVQAMRARTSIRSSGRRSEAALMTIEFEALSGRKAAGVLNEYLSLIQTEDVQSRTGRATQTLEFFDQEVSRLNEELAERSAAILQFKTENVNALPESLDFRLNQRNILQERLAQYDREASGLEQQRERLLRVFEETGDVGGFGGAASSPEQQRLDALRNQLNDALAVYSEENPRILLLKSRIAVAEEAVRNLPDANENLSAETTGNAMLDVQLAEIGSRLKVIEQQRDASGKQLADMIQTIEQTPRNAIKLDELQLDYQNIQLQYNTAVDRLSRASTGERIEVLSRGQRISVIDPPAVPNQPSKPNRKLIAAGGTFVGILAGLALVFLLEILNRSIRRPEDLVSRLGVTPLATIPYITVVGENSRRRSLRMISVFLIVIGVPVAVYAVHVLYQPLDLVAERLMDKIGVRW